MIIGVRQDHSIRDSLRAVRRAIIEHVFDGEADLAEIEECERVVAAAQARQVRALARFAKLRPGPRAGTVDEFAADELAPLLRISRSAAMVRLELAVELTTRLPGTLAALDAGSIDLYKARIIAELTDPLSAQAASAVEHHVLVRVAGQTPGQLRAALRRAVFRVDPHGAEARRQVRLAARKVVVHAGEDGTADLVAANLCAADATAIYQRLDNLARDAAVGDARTMDQRRSDTLVDLLLGRATDHVVGHLTDRSVDVGSSRAARRAAARFTARFGGLAGGHNSSSATVRFAARVADHVARQSADGPYRAAEVIDLSLGRPAGWFFDQEADGTSGQRSGRAGQPVGGVSQPIDRPGRAGARGLGRPRVHVTVAATTLLGLDELPGELAGYGPIPAQVARELAADGTWRRILTDPATGAVVDVGRRTYRPAAALAEFVRVRDRTCRFPGCRQPARRCDIDHNEAYPIGATEARNLCCLCRHHHRLKHRGEWSVHHEAAGDAMVWTSPTGRSYVTTPETIADVKENNDDPPDEPSVADQPG